MSDRQTVGVQDDQGKTSWFYAKDAKNWPATTGEGDTLYLVAGRWALLPGLASLTGSPAQFVDPEAAQEWLLCNGYAPPDELADCAEHCRLR